MARGTVSRVRVRVCTGARGAFWGVLGASLVWAGSASGARLGRVGRSTGADGGRLGQGAERVRQSGGVIMHNRRTDFL